MKNNKLMGARGLVTYYKKIIKEFNELNINWNKPLTLVEGPLDLIKTNDTSTC